MRVSTDVNILALVKGEDRYIFVYHDWQQTAVLRTLGRFASNPSLSFNWYNAAQLSQKVREQITKTP